MIYIKLSQLRVNLNNADSEYAGDTTLSRFGLVPVHSESVLDDWLMGDGSNAYNLKREIAWPAMWLGGRLTENPDLSYVRTCGRFCG